MTKQQKLEYFQKEIDLIVTADLRQFLVVAVENMFDYVFIKAGSSSGKYHPMSDLELGGLLRHIKGVFYLGYNLLSLNFMQELFNQRERDIMLIAILLHDSWKYDEPSKDRKHTTNLHPALAAEWIRTNEIFEDIVSEDDREKIACCIETHSGQWNTDKKGNELYPIPTHKTEKFVHMCDYIASRRFLNFDLGVLDTKIIEPIEAFNYVMPFGKHIGQTIEEIANTSYNYLEWAENEMYTEPARSYISKFLRIDRANNKVRNNM